MHYRADQLGSLLRPPELLVARAAHVEGRITLAELRNLEDTSILDALEMQRQTGITVFSDGEYRRSTFRSSFAESVDGMVPAESGRNWSGQSAAHRSMRNESSVDDSANCAGSRRTSRRF
jgi:5-methyltetrahydropteroyltriglutamate--homocysteine methyltransferase